uniref:Uncharacterized protein n=1 Tax=Romanomermis culicivorax TaxID=13658 RepID=A0A915JSI2_ROMCU
MMRMEKEETKTEGRMKEKQFFYYPCRLSNIINPKIFYRVSQNVEFKTVRRSCADKITHARHQSKTGTKVKQGANVRRAPKPLRSHERNIFRPRSNIPNFDQYPGVRGSAPTYGGAGSSASLVPVQPYVVQPATQQPSYYPAPAPAPAPIPSYGAAAPAYGAPGPSSASVPSPGCAMGNCAGVVSQVSPQPGQAAVAVQPPPGYSGTPGQTQYIYKPAPAPVKGGCKWCKEITPPPAYPPASPSQAGGYGAAAKPNNHLLCPTCTVNAPPGMPFIAVEMSGPQVDSHMQFVMPQPNVPCATCAGGATGPAQPSQVYGNAAPPQPLPSYVVAAATAYGQPAPAPAAASSYASGSAGVAANVYPVGTVPPSVIGGQPNVILNGTGPSNVAARGTTAGDQVASAPFPQPGNFTLPTGSAANPVATIPPGANRSRTLSESNDEDPETVGILDVDKEEELKKLRLKDPFSSTIRRRLKDTVPLAAEPDNLTSNNGVALTLSADVNSYGREPGQFRSIPNYRLHGGETVH